MRDYTKKIGYDGDINHLNLWQKAALRLLEYKEKNVIDIGCGSGSFLREISQVSKTVLGVDPNENNIKELQKINIPGKIGYLEDFKVELANQFDVATCFEVIEHLYNYKTLFYSAKEVLVTGGAFILSTPNAFNIFRAFDFLIFQEHRDSLLDPTRNEDPEHIRLWSYSMVERAFLGTSFKKVKGYGVTKLFGRELVIKNKLLVKYFSQHLIFVGVK